MKSTVLGIVALFSLSNACNGSQIHIFGDSHSFAVRDVSGCIVHHLGARTMHGMGVEKMSRLNVKKHGVRNGDVAVFIFGEIDVRRHIGRQRDKSGKDLESIVVTLVNKYIDVILINRRQFSNLACIACAVLPPSDFILPWHGTSAYGTISDRVNITKVLNEQLEEACIKRGIYFLDATSHYKTPAGSLNKNLSDGQMHIAHEHRSFLVSRLVEVVELAQKDRGQRFSVLPRSFVHCGNVPGYHRHLIYINGYPEKIASPPLSYRQKHVIYPCWSSD